MPTNFDLKTVMAHKPPMLLVDEILRTDARGALTRFTVRQDNIFLQEGKLAREALVEIMAQSFAAFNAFKGAQEGKKEEKGFLVGLRNIKIHAAAQLGDVLTCGVYADDCIAQTCIVTAQIKKGELLLAEGELRLFTF